MDPWFEYVEKAVTWAKTHGLQVMIDLHGAPGSQVSSKFSFPKTLSLNSYTHTKLAHLITLHRMEMTIQVNQVKSNSTTTLLILEEQSRYLNGSQHMLQIQHGLLQSLQSNL